LYPSFANSADLFLEIAGKDKVYLLKLFFNIPIAIAIGIGSKPKQNEKANQETQPQQEDDFKSQHERHEPESRRCTNQWPLLRQLHQQSYLWLR
jgi:hypothetical protein